MRKLIVLAAAAMLAAVADAQTSNYDVTAIVTNSRDARLVNPWGLSHPVKNHHKRNEWWVADQGSGLSTLYSASGNVLGLAITVPSVAGGPGSPTGIANSPNPAATNFAFATLDGTISAWDANAAPGKPGANCYECHVSKATIVVNNSAIGASYQGIAIAKNATSGALTYYAANSNGGVEAYDAATFSPVSLPPGAFVDAEIPSAYTPAGIQTIGSQVFVAYAASAGGGTGFVDAFDTNGKLRLRLQSGSFDRPWAVVSAPANFGTFSNAILVGNVGSGSIGAYDKTSGAFEGFLQSGGANLVIPGLWGLGFGNGASQSGPTNVLYFNAGGNDSTGVFGSITAD